MILFTQFLLLIFKITNITDLEWGKIFIPSYILLAIALTVAFYKIFNYLMEK